MEGIKVLKGGNEYGAVTMTISINLEAKIVASMVVQAVGHGGCGHRHDMVMVTTGAPLTSISHV